MASSKPRLAKLKGAARHAILLTLGRRIAARRKARWLTQGDVAMTLGVTAPYIGFVERGCRGVPYLTVVDIARALGTTAAQLAVERGVEEPPQAAPHRMRKTPKAKKPSARAKRAHHQLLVRFGDNIRRHRIAKGLTLRELAKGSGLSVAYASSLERGLRNPTYMTVVGVARALGTTTGKLFD